MTRWLPHPVSSAFVLLVWLGLHTGPGPIHVVAGLVLAVVVPRLLDPLLDDRVTLRRPWTALRLAGIVIWDIIVANIAVARRVLGPLGRLRPGFIEVPYELTHDDAIALLGSIIAITPGTVVVDIDQQRKLILVHVLDLDDPAALVAEIKHRYERPLKEIFEC